MKNYFYSREDQGSLDDLNNDFLGNGKTVWFLENEDHKWLSVYSTLTIDPFEAMQFTAKMQALTFAIINDHYPNFKPTEHEFPKK